MSLGYIASAVVTHLTQRELFVAWDLLGERVREFLATCDTELEDQSVDRLREAIRMLDRFDATPGRRRGRRPAICDDRGSFSDAQ